VGWDERLFDLLDDLEGQAEALYAVEREAELADRSRAEYAAVTLGSRLMASVGDEVALDLAGVGRVAGTLQRLGTGWCLVRAVRSDWLVLLDALVSVAGASGRSVPEVAWSPLSRLGPGAMLRALADEALPSVVHTRDGGRRLVSLTRVGQDFVEAVDDAGRGLLLPLTTLAAVQSRSEVAAVRPGSPSTSG
jgi:hypothetical protein